MNALEKANWLEAVGDCFPKLKMRELGARLNGLDALFPDAQWEGGLNTLRCWTSLGFRCRLAPERFPAWLEATSSILRIKPPGRTGPQEISLKPPPSGFPWLTLLWDVEMDKPHAIILFGVPKRPKLKSDQAVAWVYMEGPQPISQITCRPGRFSPGIFKEPAVEDALKSFSRLCPVKDIVWQSGASWSLRLASPVSWPKFLRLDVAKAFADHSSQSAFLLLNRRVRELQFQEESLWAFFGA